MTNFTACKTVFIYVLVISATLLSGCRNNMHVLQVDTNNIINVNIPSHTEFVEVSFVVPKNAGDSGLSFSIESPFVGLKIALTNPNKTIVATETTLGAFQFSPSQFTKNIKWTFDKVIEPMPGVWTFRFFVSKDINATFVENAIPIQLSVGLVPKYTAFVKPLETKAEVGQAILIQLRLSEFGVPRNIEGHEIQVINQMGERVDTLTVSKQLIQAEGTLST